MALRSYSFALLRTKSEEMLMFCYVALHVTNSFYYLCRHVLVEQNVNVNEIFLPFSAQQRQANAPAVPSTWTCLEQNFGVVLKNIREQLIDLIERRDAL